MQRDLTQTSKPAWRSMIGQAAPLLLVAPIVLLGLAIAGMALWALFGTAIKRWIGG